MKFDLYFNNLLRSFFAELLSCQSLKKQKQNKTKMNLYMHTDDFLYTDFRFRWKMNEFLQQHILLKKNQKKKSIYVI